MNIKLEYSNFEKIEAPIDFLEGYWRFLYFLSFQTNFSAMSFNPSFRPMKMYYYKEFHVCVGTNRVGEWKKSYRRDVTYWKSIVPIPASVEDRTIGYTPAFATVETQKRVWPRDSGYDPSEFTFVGSPINKIYTNGTGKITIKAAFRNRTTGDIVLLTGTNRLPTEKNVPALVDGWYTYTADMVAPAIFWDILLDNV